VKFTALICLAAALLGAGWFETISLRQHNALRRVQVAELHRLAERSTSRDAETRSTPAKTQVASATTDSSPSTAANEAARIRAEITALEKSAAEQYASNPEATDAPATNRDPEKAMTRLEFFQNVGQGTPAAAFQTLVWAALKGESTIMAQTIGVDETSRRQVLEMITASLSEADREKYPTPESVLALFLAKALVRVSALQIVSTDQTDALNATVTVRGLMGNDQKLPMRLGATGWQLWEGEKNIEWLRTEFRPRKKS
jgi:hypothetical protein